MPELIWEKGYFDVYNVVTRYVPYKEHMNYICDSLQLDSTSKVLDLGCGTGELLNLCSKITNYITGLDGSEAMLRSSQQNICSKAELIRHDFSKELPFSSNLYDRAVSNNVLGYLENPKLFVSEMFRVLKPGGIFLVCTMKPDFDPIRIFLDHVKQSSFLNNLKILPSSVMVGIHNKRIVQKIKSGKYTGYDENSLRALMDKFPVKQLSFASSYSNQSIVMKGVKG